MVLKQLGKRYPVTALFENDVEMYGAQTDQRWSACCTQFENDVEMYGAQTRHTG